nr:seed storage albumin 6 precursor [Helianthus annuus]
MAKLILLAIAFASVVAFVSAHTTIITTTIIDDDDQNPISQQQECRQRVQEREFNQCESYLLEGQTSFDDNKHKKKHQEQEQEQGLQQCCNELQNVDKECQCEAVKKVFRDVQHQRGGGDYGSQEIQQLKHKAQNLPNQCKLKTKRCQIGTIITTTAGNPFWPLGSKQCTKSEVQGRVNQCRRYVEKEIFGRPRTLVMSINKREQEQQGLQECCNELQNMRKECQCEAMKEVMRQTKQQGGKQDEQMQVVRHVLQNLPNQCGLDVQQCHIPNEMF